MGGQSHKPAALPPGNIPVHIIQENFGAKDRFGLVRKNSTPPRFDLQSFQPVASGYTDWATSAHCLEISPLQM